uniref:Uncharacterized protein n=1 Tax=Siphoviridae sp. ctpbb7 TaxID=2826465 RepID=A0A8S5N1F3_9CAUD|nr:MAG TPA: hypothetical protein [Siphoviridae sp. ctpbb7]
MKMSEALAYRAGSDHIQIIRDGDIVFTGYKASLEFIRGGAKLAELKITGNEEVKLYDCHLEIKHRDYENLGLMKPIRPDMDMPYKFQDLMLTMWYRIEI